MAIATFRALLDKDLRPDLAKIDRPVLVLHGTRDASVPLEISGAPYGLFVTHLHQVNRELEAFIRA